jgi:hypothetical protein
MTDTIEGVLLLDRERARDRRFPWVVLCELPDAKLGPERFVVWYEDSRGRRSIGYYTTRRDDAQAEFERRT